MMDQELISIIVSVYNSDTTLARCLRSLERQTYQNIEILLIDDASTDQSRDICRKWSEKDKRFRLFTAETNKGVAGARNIGLDHFSGKYLMFADADDIVADNYVERLYEVLIKSGCNIATCIANDSEDIYPDDYTFKCETKTEPRLIAIEDYDFMRIWSHRVVWGALFRREIIGGLKFRDQYQTSTDTLFIAELFKGEKQIVHIDEPLYIYISNPASVTHRNYDWKRYCNVKVWKEIAHRIFSDGPEMPRQSAEMQAIAYSIRGLREMEAQYSDDDVLRKELLSNIKGKLPLLFSLDRIPFTERLRPIMISLFPHLFLLRQRAKRS